MFEGFAYGRANNEGYNNPYDYKAGMSIDILVMGSSHIEGFFVMPENITANLLAKISGRAVYNAGTAGHYFPTEADHLEAAVNKYHPSQYVVVEALTTSFKDSELKEILSHDTPREIEKKRGIIRTVLRQSPYVRFLHHKVMTYIKKHFSEPDTKASGLSNSELLSEVLMYMKNTAVSSGAKVIVLYHPSIEIGNDGKMIVRSDLEAAAQFAGLCAENGIYFLDMSRRFLDEYAKNYTLPHGFFNTSLGNGHTNKHGTRMFAEEIYSLIQRIEAGS